MSGALWQRFHGDNGTRRKRSELKAAVDAQSTNEDVESTKWIRAVTYIRIVM